MMALGLPTNMDLKFFKGNGVAMTLAPLDIMLICFVRHGHVLSKSSTF
jgi:hypothetical protein